MGELLRLGAVELGLSRLGEDLGQGQLHVLRSKGHRKVLELVMVQRQNGEVQVVQTAPLHDGEIRIREHLRQLHLPFAPAAAEDHGIVVPDAAHGNTVLRQDHGLQVIVVQTGCIGAFDGLRKAGAAAISCRHLQ